MGLIVFRIKYVKTGECSYSVAAVRALFVLKRIKRQGGIDYWCEKVRI